MECAYHITYVYVVVKKKFYILKHARIPNNTYTQKRTLILHIKLLLLALSRKQSETKQKNRHGKEKWHFTHAQDDKHAQQK